MLALNHEVLFSLREQTEHWQAHTSAAIAGVRVTPIRGIRAAVKGSDQAARSTRVSISLRSAPKSMGFVKSASAPRSKAFCLVSASP